jgi:mannose-6-phosphate isomerase-like protein (cupin superfamily)
VADHVGRPVVLEAAGAPPKKISEFAGRPATGSAEVSVAVMESPAGWSEPGQRPDFEEITVVIEGEVHAETEDGPVTISAGEALRVRAGEWVRYSTPATGGARYVAVCVPAFSPETVNRDDAAG